MTQKLHLAESLRSPTLMARPDPRAGVQPGSEHASLAAQHAEVVGLVLNGGVPEPVAIQFETAKNLYLYAWHVYRFYPVAQLQALRTLEFGLREAMPPDDPNEVGQQHGPGLAKLVKQARARGLIRNEGFSRWHRAAERTAQERVAMERIQKMIDEGLSELVWDEQAPVEIKPEDRDWNLVGVLEQGLHHQRNALAHGGSYLHSQVRGTLELVMEILNQLFQTATDPELPLAPQSAPAAAS